MPEPLPNKWLISRVPLVVIEPSLYIPPPVTLVLILVIVTSFKVAVPASYTYKHPPPNDAVFLQCSIVHLVIVNVLLIEAVPTANIE